MNEWSRRVELDDAFKDMHKIKPKVSRMRENSKSYFIKLEYGGKEVILHEVMRDGLTEYVTLEHKGIILNQPNMYQAELKAVEIFKEK